jgi:hypothetical protein
MTRRVKLLACVAALALAVPSIAAAPADPFAGTQAREGLLPVHVDKAGGRVLLTLPAPGADGVAGRFLYATTLRTGVGSAELGLDHGQNGETRLLAFRPIGGKIAIQYENPRFRATGASAPEQAAARDSFITTTAWMGAIAATLPDGRLVIDIAPFLAKDTMGIAPALAEAGAKGYRLVDAMSIADPAATKVFPDNIELEALQTYASDTPGRDMENVAPDARQVSFTVHHSLVRLPDAGYKPRAFDPRAGGFASQAVDFAVPLGGALVYDLADRFLLEKTDPTAARSTVKKPIVFYIDSAAPPDIRQALFEGVSWWSQAFDAAGLIDAFQVKMLPPGVDPMDVRYNVVNWVDRATRGWSFGQVIADPRTGEIVKGSVLLGALRVRQDIIIYEGLVGTAGLNSGGPNDPVRVALARIRQLGAHEVGHALGFAHNFAGSTQGRSTFMDYPAPRIGLKDGAPDLSDAYGVGAGAWDKFVVDWAYGTDSDAAARAKADAAVKAGLRYVSDADSRGSDVGQPWGSLWDDGADPAAELTRMMQVRAAALARFGSGALTPGEPVANLRRKLVPVWLVHRYQVDAAAKLVGGVDYSYSTLGDGREASPAVPATAQRAAIDALLATLAPDALRMPAKLVPLLSAASMGSYDRQYDIEVFTNAGGPVFDPLVAADVAASLTLDALLSPARLNRVMQQHARDAALPGLDELLGKLAAATIDGARDDVGQRIAWRTALTLARARRDAAGIPGVAGALDDRLTAISDGLAKKSDAWSRGLAKTIRDKPAIEALADLPRTKLKVPPGMPIGDAAEYMDLPLP